MGREDEDDGFGQFGDKQVGPTLPLSELEGRQRRRGLRIELRRGLCLHGGGGDEELNITSSVPASLVI